MSTQFGVRPNLHNPKFFPERSRFVDRPVVTPAGALLVFGHRAWTIWGVDLVSLRRDVARGRALIRVAFVSMTVPETPLSMMRIVAEVAGQFGLTVEQVRGRQGRNALARARHEAMWRCYRETRHSLTAIGRYFDGRDHTTVLHAVRKLELEAQRAAGGE